MMIKDPVGDFFNYVKPKFETWVSDQMNVFKNDENNFKFFINGSQTEDFEDGFSVQFSLTRGKDSSKKFYYDANIEMELVHPDGEERDYSFIVEYTDLEDFNAFGIGALEVDTERPAGAGDFFIKTLSYDDTIKAFDDWFEALDAEF